MLSDARTVLSLYAPCGGGGVIQVFRNLRSAAGEFGVDLRWLGCGARAMEAARRYARPEDWECGEIVGPALEGDNERAEEYRRQIIDRRPVAVLFHVRARIRSRLRLSVPRARQSGHSRLVVRRGNGPRGTPTYRSRN
jgi:hypothetical protein